MDKKEDNNFAEKHNMRWVIMITIWTFIMAIVFSIITEGLVAATENAANAPFNNIYRNFF